MKDGQSVKLTEHVTAGGCAAKIGPGELSKILDGLKLKSSAKLLVGIDSADDASVYRLDEKTAVVQTLDFFTPIVDDPYLFGQIAAANALSDVYAMGGRPILAMNILAFPCGLGPEVIRAVLAGGAERVEAAGAVVAGGHSLEDKEPKYGLSVLGLIKPHKVITNAGAKIGDMFVLTKPLGLGILTTALRQKVVDEAGIAQALNAAVDLNDKAAEAMVSVGVNAATDVTGFGLAGHLLEMLEAAGVSAYIETGSLPIWPDVFDLAGDYQPGGTGKNEDFFGPRVELASKSARELAPIVFDPQTSGGLLISVPEAKLAMLLKELGDRGVKTRAVIGRVVKSGVGATLTVE